MGGWHERFRVVGAVALAPSLGFGAGIGFGLTKQVALNAGGIMVMADTASASRIGEKVTTSVPFDVGWIPAVFVGASVRLK